jgi:hypothetical protein
MMERDPEQELIAALKREFPDWHVYKGVGEVGWYAQRPRSSPKWTVGPYPLWALGGKVGQWLREKGKTR